MPELKTELFDYHLPPELIAQTPLPARDSSRLFVLPRTGTGAQADWEHRHFSDLPQYLRAGDVLVLNRTRVMPARLLGVKEGTGARVETLLLRRRPEVGPDVWEVLLKPAKRLKPGQALVFGDRLRGELQQQLDAEKTGSEAAGTRLMAFAYDGIWEEVLEALGEMPLPPYITERLADGERYQTVYARETGSAAAPTAGLHFTPELLETLRQQGVEVREILLHVGLGTFRPVQAETIDEHFMHSEFFALEAETAAAINRAKAEGRRVIAVGTTVVRTLETAAARSKGPLSAMEGWTDIFIYPGYDFLVIDGLITNFHFPRSTLLMLVSAFAGRERVLAAYEEAVRQRYRFYSFGDAMFIG